MDYVQLGKTGLRAAAFALGTGSLGATRQGGFDPEQASGVLRAYVEAGGNVIGTSDAYGGGRSEEMIGTVLGPQRDELILVSKYGRTPDRSTAPGRVGNHRKAMVQAVEGSLHRLGTDRIDVYMAHFDDAVTPVEEIMRGFEQLTVSGKILYSGLSNFSAWRTAQAATLADTKGWAPLIALEVEYSLLQRGTEREILPLAREMNLAVLGYSPLAAGMLTGHKDEKSTQSASRMGLMPEGDLPRTLQALRSVAKEHAAEPAHVALAWIRAKGVIPVLGVRTDAQLADNLQAAAVRLTPLDIERLDEASAIPLGYPQALMAAFLQAQ